MEKHSTIVADAKQYIGHVKVAKPSGQIKPIKNKEIAKQIGVNLSVLLSELKKAIIEAKNEDIIDQRGVKRKKSITELAKEYNIAATTVSALLNRSPEANKEIQTQIMRGITGKFSKEKAGVYRLIKRLSALYLGQSNGLTVYTRPLYTKEILAILKREGMASNYKTIAEIRKKEDPYTRRYPITDNHRSIILVNGKDFLLAKKLLLLENRMPLDTILLDVEKIRKQERIDILVAKGYSEDEIKNILTEDILKARKHFESLNLSTANINDLLARNVYSTLSYYKLCELYKDLLSKGLIKTLRPQFVATNLFSEKEKIELLNKNKGLIASVLRRIFVAGASYEDKYQYTYTYLWHYLDSYDPKKSKLSTFIAKYTQYAMHTLRREMTHNKPYSEVYIEDISYGDKNQLPGTITSATEYHNPELVSIFDLAMKSRVFTNAEKELLGVVKAIISTPGKVKPLNQTTILQYIKSLHNKNITKQAVSLRIKHLLPKLDKHYPELAKFVRYLQNIRTQKRT